MKKIRIPLLFVIIFVFAVATGCENEAARETPQQNPLELFYDEISAAYAEQVMESLISFGTNHDFGFRTSGSEAELAAADYLLDEMFDIGLENVVKDALKADSWEFTVGSLSFADSEGGIREIRLASYPAHFECEDEEMMLVYAGFGTEFDYDELDVDGKLVLIDINEAEDWRIDWPAYQAGLRGAKAVIAISVGGFAQYNDGTLGIQDTLGRLSAPAFSVAARDGAELIRQIEEAESGEIEVRLTADSRIEPDRTVYAVVGEIPGRQKTDEIILMTAHYDGFFQGFADNAAGVGTVLGIAKTLIDSGYTPEKTIRFVLHPAFEWGGGAQAAVNKNSDWPENTFVLISIGGGVTCNYAEGIEVRTSFEMSDHAGDVGYDVEGSPFDRFEATSPVPATSEGFPYAQKGVPVLCSGFSGIEEQVSEVYHTNRDTKDYLYNEETILYAMKLYGAYLIGFDLLPVKPLDYSVLFHALSDSVAPEAAANAENLLDALYEAILAAEDLAGVIAKSAPEREEATELNRGLFRISGSIQEKLMSLTPDNRVIFAHERHQRNVLTIRSAIEMLQKRDVKSALDRLSEVDLNKYARYFDRDTFDHFYSPGDADLFDVVRSILSKSEYGSAANYLEEAQLLEIELIGQQKLLRDAISQMTKDVISITKSIHRISIL